MGLTITTLIWVIGIHSIVHGLYGIFHVHSSMYVNYDPELITLFTLLNVIMIVLGVSLFCVLVWKRPMCAKILAAVIVLVALLYFIIGLVYFMTFLPFFANSIFDAFFCYTDVECWVGPDYPMTIWHILTFLVVFTILLWLVYALLLCKYANCLCCMPTTQNSCQKRRRACEENYVPANPCCKKQKFFQKLFKQARCGPNPGQCCMPQQTCQQQPSPCPPPCPPMCNNPPPPQPYPQNFPPQCPSAGPPPCAVAYNQYSKKSPKFILTLKPGKVCGK